VKKIILIIVAVVMAVIAAGLFLWAGRTPDGDFSAVVGYRDSEIKSWRSDEGIFYLFLPGDISLPALTFSCSGIRIRSTDHGSFDQKSGTVTGAFAESGDAVTITSENRQDYNVVALQADLPGVMIELSDTTLETVNAGLKDTEYEGSAVMFVDREGSADTYENVVLKGRGNTSWEQAAKKSYQLVFEEDTGVFGMEPAGKWILQANAFDETMMRNEIAFRASRRMGMPFTMDFVYANVWVDGMYIGTYYVGEKVELGEGRVGLSDPEGILVELDKAYYGQNEYWFETDYDVFGVRGAVSEEHVEDAVGQFDSLYDGVYTYLEKTDPAAVSEEELSKYIDIDSFVRMYFLLDFFRNTDSYLSSTYFYLDGEEDVIHFGPVWDYDCSMGNPASPDKADPDGNDYENGLLISLLLKTDCFAERVREYFNSNKEVFEDTLEDCDLLYRELLPAAAMNYTRWEYALGADHSNQYGVKRDIGAFHDTYEDGYLYLKNWLSERIRHFEECIPVREE